MLVSRAMGCCIALAGLLEAFAFCGSPELIMRSKHVRHDFAARAISSDRLQSWSPSGGRLQIEHTDTHVDAQNRVNVTLAAVDDADDVDSSNLDETQLLLACRAYLSKKNKLKWQGKKIRREAARSIEGHFWSDPDELVYLRDRPDPYNLLDNSTDVDEAFNSAYIDSSPLDEETVEYSMNPFSTNPLYPSDEHIKRSRSRAHLWSNETWKRAWYEKRWEGKKVTEVQRTRKNAKRRIDSMPLSIIDAPEFSSMSEEEILNATLMYVRAREKMAESKRQLHRERMAQREDFRQRRAALRREGEEMARIMKTTNSSRSDIIESSIVPFPNFNGTPSLAELRRQGEQMAFLMKTTNSSRLELDCLSFEPSSDVMVELKAKRSVKAKLAYRTRIAKKSKKSTTLNTEEDKTKFRQSYSSVQIASDSSIQAIIRINDALDCGEVPSKSDVRAIMKPKRFGRRKDILLRILRECLGLQGKCIPKQMNGKNKLEFPTKCSIQDLGDFIVSKL
jgi:hypothetical protein